jgi:hypothetical protein
MTLKIAVLAPIPSAIVTMAITVNAGVRRSVLAAYAASFSRLLIAVLPRDIGAPVLPWLNQIGA